MDKSVISTIFSPIGIFVVFWIYVLALVFLVRCR